LIKNKKDHRLFHERHGIDRQEFYKEFIIEYRDSFRLKESKESQQPISMHIPYDEPEIKYTLDKDNNSVIKKVDNKSRNAFDKSTYTYFPKMVKQEKSIISHNILVSRIVAEYKKRFKSKEVTIKNIKNIVLWTILNPDSILVIKSDMPKYEQIKLIFERLDQMGVLHFFYSDRKVKIITHMTINEKDGSTKQVKTNSEGMTYEQLFKKGLVKSTYYHAGVIATYQTIDHSQKEYRKKHFPFTYPEDD
jgi:hypothetical protein